MVSSRRRLARLGLVAAAAMAWQAGAVRAEEPGTVEAIERLRKEIERQAGRLAEDEHRLTNELRLLREEQDALKGRIETLSGGKAAPPVPRPTAIPEHVQSPPVQRTQATIEPPEAVGRMLERKRRPPEVPSQAERGGVLLPPGRFVFEPSVEYVRSDVNRADVVGFTVLPGIVFGDINISEAKRDTVVATAGARLGVTERLEIETKIPYIYRHDTTRTRPVGTSAVADVTTMAYGRGLGDVEVAAHYQVNDGRGGWPYFIANMRVRSPTGRDPFEVPHDPMTNAETTLPTGTGFWAVQPSVTLLMPSDPAVLFGGLSYTWNMARDVGTGYGRIDPGDVIGANFGFGVSLNEDLSFSMGYDHSVVLETKRDGRPIPGASLLQVGTLTLGTSYRISQRTSINLSVGVGVTHDAPNLRVLAKVPVALSFW